ncbi:hypothetical protein Bca4012_038935 [Brassica carinata]
MDHLKFCFATGSPNIRSWKGAISAASLAPELLFQQIQPPSISEDHHPTTINNRPKTTINITGILFYMADFLFVVVTAITSYVTSDNLNL